MPGTCPWARTCLLYTSKRIKSNLDEEIEQKRNVSLLRENYIKSLPILREQFINELISYPVPERCV